MQAQAPQSGSRGRRGPGMWSRRHLWREQSTARLQQANRQELKPIPSPRKHPHSSSTQIYKRRAGTHTPADRPGMPRQAPSGALPPPAERAPATPAQRRRPPNPVIGPRDRSVKSSLRVAKQPPPPLKGEHPAGGRCAPIADRSERWGGLGTQHAGMQFYRKGSLQTTAPCSAINTPTTNAEPGLPLFLRCSCFANLLVFVLVSLNIFCALVAVANGPGTPPRR